MDIDTNRDLNALLNYAIETGLIEAQDAHYYANALLDILGLVAFERDETATTRYDTATPLLEPLIDYMILKGRCIGTAEARELLEARIMGALTPPPAAVRARFDAIRAAEGARAATDWFYALCRSSNYIRVDDIARNIRFDAPSRYGTLGITINLSKPEKDPSLIAAERSAPPSGYPRCMLCAENEGYSGRDTIEGIRRGYPARQNLRAIPLELCGETWRIQYSPYLYYDEHLIAFAPRHRPMRIERATFERLLAFVDALPHYFIGSNADLPIVGGSILGHDHFQGGLAAMPMLEAPVRVRLTHARYPAISVGLVDWPMTALRLESADADALVELSCAILEHWRGYSDPSANILAQTDAPHNTVTPVARKLGGVYAMDIVLRNNRTSKERPQGIFHPHADLHNIKRENIGLIEAMGLFILPGRLKDELAEVEAYLADGIALPAGAHMHAAFAQGIKERAREGITRGNVHVLVREALTDACARVLEDAGVFKGDDEGKGALGAYLLDAGLEKR